MILEPASFGTIIESFTQDQLISEIMNAPVGDMIIINSLLQKYTIVDNILQLNGQPITDKYFITEIILDKEIDSINEYNILLLLLELNALDKLSKIQLTITAFDNLDNYYTNIFDVIALKKTHDLSSVKTLSLNIQLFNIISKHIIINFINLFTKLETLTLSMELNENNLALSRDILALPKYHLIKENLHANSLLSNSLEHMDNMVIKVLNSPDPTITTSAMPINTIPQFNETIKDDIILNLPSTLKYINLNIKSTDNTFAEKLACDSKIETVIINMIKQAPCGSKKHTKLNIKLGLGLGLSLGFITLICIIFLVRWYNNRPLHLFVK